MTPTTPADAASRLAALIARRREAGAGFWAATRAGDAVSAADFDSYADELDALIAAETARQTGTGVSTYSSVYWNI